MTLRERFSELSGLSLGAFTFREHLERFGANYQNLAASSTNVISSVISLKTTEINISQQENKSYILNTSLNHAIVSKEIKNVIATTEINNGC